jgi:chromosomal replication initiation ATPase DnaA
MIEPDKLKELKRCLNSTKPIYLYGKSGVGKTELIKKLDNAHFISIQDINEYEDILLFMKPSIIELFSKKECSKICVIDNIDYLHTHEKKVLTSFLKQFKLEEKRKKTRSFPIILCGTNIHDKKIKEIVKLSNMITIHKEVHLSHNQYEKNIQHNIRQIMMKEFNEDNIIENEKATQALFFHENIVDCIKPEHYSFYYNFLENICVGDYFDRISFQKQLWIFNEMTYYIKILHNYYLYKKTKIQCKKVPEYRFTKVLTKYSNEYNNNTFIIGLCNKLNCSKKELYYKIIRKDTEELSQIEINRASLYFQLKV